MADNIEDFLKRAAERRQAKAAQTPPTPAPSRPTRPEYTNARSERKLRNESDDEEPIRAVVVEQVSARESAMRQAAAAQAAAAQAAKLQAILDKAKTQYVGTVAPVEPPVPVTPLQSRSEGGAAPGKPALTAADQLVELLRRPDGMLQAMLVQEILQRPTHRW